MCLTTWTAHIIEDTTLLDSSADVQLVTELYLYIFQVTYNKLEDSRLDSTLSIVRHHFRTTYFIRNQICYIVTEKFICRSHWYSSRYLHFVIYLCSGKSETVYSVHGMKMLRIAFSIVITRVLKLFEV